MLLCLYVVLFGKPGELRSLETISENNSADIEWLSDGLIIPGTLHGVRFAGTAQENGGHHGIVWKNGKAAGRALFTSPVPDSVVYHALVRVGAIPGNNLTIDTWDDRRNADAPEPKKHVEGSVLNVAVQCSNDTTWIPFRNFFTDRGGRGIEVRFGGHLHFISVWESGCIVCMYSCPGGKMSNARYSIRDFVEEQTDFRVAPQFSRYREMPVRIRFLLVNP